MLSIWSAFVSGFYFVWRGWTLYTWMVFTTMQVTARPGTALGFSHILSVYLRISKQAHPRTAVTFDAASCSGVFSAPPPASSSWSPSLTLLSPSSPKTYSLTSQDSPGQQAETCHVCHTAIETCGKGSFLLVRGEVSIWAFEPSSERQSMLSLPPV